MKGVDLFLRCSFCFYLFVLEYTKYTQKSIYTYIPTYPPPPKKIQWTTHLCLLEAMPGNISENFWRCPSHHGQPAVRRTRNGTTRTKAAPLMYDDLQVLPANTCAFSTSSYYTTLKHIKSTTIRLFWGSSHIFSIYIYIFFQKIFMSSASKKFGLHLDLYIVISGRVCHRDTVGSVSRFRMHDPLRTWAFKSWNHNI